MKMRALQPMIATIGKRFFRRLVQKYAAPLDKKIDWAPENIDEFANKAFDVLSKDVPDIIESRNKLYPQLFNIHTLSERTKDGPAYLQCIKQCPSEIRAKWLKDFGNTTPPIQTMSAWMLLEVPDLFENLLSLAFAKCSEANGGYKFYLKKNHPVSLKDPNGAFKKELKSFLKVDYGFDMHVTIEQNKFIKYTRFIVTTDPFPSNGQRFSKQPANKDKDVLETSLKEDVDFFYISFVETSRYSYFQIKSDHDQRQREAIANLFAKHVLSSVIGPKPEQNRDLNPFRSRPKQFDFSNVDGFVSKRYEGVNMRIESGGRKKDIYVRRFTNEDFYDAIERTDELARFPDEAKDIVELYLEVVLKSGEPPSQLTLTGFTGFDDRKEKTYLITIKKHGFWTSKPTATECDEHKIDQILELMGLQDITGDKILRRKTRK